MHTALNTFSRMLVFIFVIHLLMLKPILAQEKILYGGEWQADSYFTTFKGSWSIVEQDGQTLIRFHENFQTKKAPDLKLFLSTLELDDLDGDNAADPKTSVLISLLTSYKGKASYVLSPDIDLSQYQTILVHCEQYAKFWGGSPLD